MDTPNIIKGKYNIVIGTGLLSELGSYVAEITQGKTALIVSDDTVFDLYGKKVSDALVSNGFSVYDFVFPHGEASKNGETLFSALEKCAESKLKRDSVVVALGGGVTGDIGGLVSALYMRGIFLVQVPTSLLAMVDSSVGGKSAVNSAKGKNLFGVIREPDLVICDTDTLKTLPEKEFRNGYAEIIKYSVLNEIIFEYENTKNNPANTIETCVRVKMRYTAEDLYDKGMRRLLNFGHTIGHAIEKACGYSVGHGEAVAIGMSVIARGAVSLYGCDSFLADYVEKQCNDAGLPTHTDIPSDIIYSIACGDKKNDENGITVILPKEFGRCEVKKISPYEFKKLIKVGLSK